MSLHHYVVPRVLNIRSRLTFYFAISALTFLSGCIHEVTQERGFRFARLAGRCVILRTNAALVVGSEYADYSIFSSELQQPVEPIEKDNQDRPRPDRYGYVGTLPAGVRIRIDKLIQNVYDPNCNLHPV